MAISIIEGLTGTGKSYTGVNFWLEHILLTTKRPVLTNLPLNVDDFILYLVQKSKRRLKGPFDSQDLAQGFRDRIFCTYGCRKLPVTISQSLREKCEDNEIEVPEFADPSQEFYYFVKPNTYILLDECADLFNALDFRQLHKTPLGTFVRHHRHIKTDMGLMVQDRSNLAKIIREQAHSIFECANSLNEPWINIPVIDSIKNWKQYFIVREYMKKQGQAHHIATFRVHPTPEGFANYNSFSPPEGLDFLDEAEEDAESGDLGNTKSRAFRLFIHQLPTILMVFAGFGTALFIAVYAWKNFLFPSAPPSKEVSLPTPPLSTSSIVESPEPQKETSGIEVLYVTHQKVVTNEKTYLLKDALLDPRIAPYVRSALGELISPPSGNQSQPSR